MNPTTNDQALQAGRAAPVLEHEHEAFEAVDGRHLAPIKAAVAA